MKIAKVPSKPPLLHPARERFVEALMANTRNARVERLPGGIERTSAEQTHGSFRYSYDSDLIVWVDRDSRGQLVDYGATTLRTGMDWEEAASPIAKEGGYAPNGRRLAAAILTLDPDPEFRQLAALDHLGLDESGESIARATAFLKERNLEKPSYPTPADFSTSLQTGPDLD